MKHSYSYSLILLPLLMLVALSSALFVQRSGITYTVNSEYYKSTQFLPDDLVEVKNFFPEKPTEALVIYDAQNTDKNIEIMVEDIYATLDSMRVKYDSYDSNSSDQIDLTKYQTVVFAALDISVMDAQVASIVSWMENGGKIMFAIRPDPSATFTLISRHLGFVSLSEELVSAKGVEFTTDLFPGAKGVSIGLQFIDGSSYAVELESTCTIHIVSADDNKIPLLWECNIGKGRVVFINSDQFGDKAARGTLGAAYTLMFDTFVYPVINTSVLFIDDFPAPLPEGENNYITRFYGDMGTETFYRDVWWPDMEMLAAKYNLKYTGGMIETYTQVVDPPLVKQLEPETHKYLGRSLLAIGGEIIFHGHNHVPFCTVDTDVNSSNDYPSWPNTEAEQLSLVELYNFGNSVFPDYKFLGYIPPSNILCSDSRRWLPMVVPDLKYIASVYLPDEDAQEYEQEFIEASDGIIEVPRVISEYNVFDNEYMQWALLNELSLHYVNSHFIHPDDLLDPERGAERGWEELKSKFDRFLGWLRDSAPGLRNMVGSESAMAVQRFSRVAMEFNDNGGELDIALGNFYDEAWLMLRSTTPPRTIEGGAITPVTSNLYLIHATASEIKVTFEE